MPSKTKLTEEQKAECRTLRKLYFREKERSRMTHSTLAKMIGKSTPTVTAMINGKLKITLDTGKKLAPIFGIELAELLPWTGRLQAEAKYSDIIESLEKLDQENLQVALRMIRALSESQEEQ